MTTLAAKTETLKLPAHAQSSHAASAERDRVPSIAPVELLLRELVDLQRQTLAAIVQLTERRPAPSLSRDDARLLAKLLPAIAGALGSEQFASRDLSTASPGLRVVLRGVSVKQIGKLLARAEGVPIEGYLVERSGVEINVTLWRILASVSNRLETGTAIGHSDSIRVGEPNA